MRGQQLSLTTSGLFPKAVLLRTAGTAAFKEEAMGAIIDGGKGDFISCGGTRVACNSFRLALQPTRPPLHVNSRAWLSRVPFQARGVAPKVFQTVEGAFGLMKDMNNYLEIIEHDPLAGGKSVNGGRANTVILL